MKAHVMWRVSFPSDISLQIKVLYFSRDTNEYPFDNTLDTYNYGWFGKQKKLYKYHWVSPEELTSTQKNASNMKRQAMWNIFKSSFNTEEV